jgi:hypothetical protein
MKKNMMKHLLKDSEEQSKYRGKCVSIVEDRLIAIGRNRVETYEKRSYDFNIPTEEETVPLL